MGLTVNRLITRGAITAFAMLNILSCSDSTSPDALSADDLSADAYRSIGSIQVTLASSSIDSATTTQATAAVYDRRGRPLSRTVIWSSDNTTVATVDSAGLVTGMSVGTATITASRNGVSGSATITVNRVGTQSVTPVASVMVALAASSIAVGQTTQATATARDSAGNTLPGRTITWAISDSSVAMVSASGVVTGLTAGSAQVIGSSEGKSGSAPLTVTSGSPPPATNPGTVTDLRVVSFDSTSVALAFTQVNDGTGQPAKYDVRYAITPISWGSATSTTQGSCTTPVAGTAIGATLNCRVAGLTPSTKYDFQVIAFRGTLNQDAVFGSLSNIVSATTSASASPPPPPPPPPGTFNEPTGMTLVTQRPFSSLQEDPKWDTDSNLTIAQDATGPASPPGALRVTFPAGFVAGNSPGHAGTQFSTSYRTLYIRYWTKYSSNWQGQQTFSKQLYVWVDENGGYPPIFFGAEGEGTTSPLTPEPVLQRMIVGDGFKSPNLVPNAVFTRGQWDMVELVLVGNTAGHTDGSVDWYLNGVHIGSVHNLQFANGDAKWFIFEYYPVWGGQGGPNVQQSMWIQWDHVYISGKN